MYAVQLKLDKDCPTKKWAKVRQHFRGLSSIQEGRKFIVNWRQLPASLTMGNVEGLEEEDFVEDLAELHEL